MSFDLKTAIGSIAPTLATMLGGPLAGAAVGALAQAFGLSPSASQEDITKVVQGGQMTPDIIAAVRAADQKHAEIMGQQGIDLAKLNADHDAAMVQADVSNQSSARQMQIAQPSKWPGVLSAITTLSVIGVILARMYGESLPQDATTVQLIGSLTTGWGMALSYWFGTTRASNNKDALLAQSVPGKQ